MLERSPERVAWITLIVAQITCAVLVMISLSGGWWFFYNSSANLEISLGVARGTIVLIDAASANREPVQVRRTISRQHIVTSDDVTQGTLQFRDNGRNGLVVANVTVFPKSQVRVTTARSPRFSFSVPDYSIQLTGIEGRIEIEIAPDLPKKLTLTAHGSGDEIIFNKSGLYNITNQGGQLQLTNYDDLVENPRFFLPAQPGFPEGWACSTEAENDMPRGTYTRGLFNGRLALRFIRESSGPSEIGCRQVLGEGIEIQGLDVSQYRSVRLRATLQILSQSVTTCGIEASECPLMLEVTFTNSDGTPSQQWHHGFYAFEYPGQLTINRITCDTCLVEHDRITPRTWYTYESPNLFELPPGYQPQRIEQIRFYSSGHAYEVYVAEITLIGELAEPKP